MYRIDLTGEKFGKLTALKAVGKDKNNNTLWLCKCDCGNNTTVRLNTLRSGRTRSCGCLHVRSKTSLTGEKFGKLTVIGFSRKDGRNNRLWLCRCECGNAIEASTVQLRKGFVESCGCDKSINGFRVYKSIEGKKFGKLTAIKPVRKDKSGGYVWLCKCECGNLCEVARRSLVSGATKSCGCIHKGRKDSA